MRTTRFCPHNLSSPPPSRLNRDLGTPERGKQIPNRNRFLAATGAAILLPLVACELKAQNYVPSSLQPLQQVDGMVLEERGLQVLLSNWKPSYDPYCYDVRHSTPSNLLMVFLCTELVPNAAPSFTDSGSDWYTLSSSAVPLIGSAALGAATSGALSVADGIFSIGEMSITSLQLVGVQMRDPDPKLVLLYKFSLRATDPLGRFPNSPWAGNADRTFLLRYELTTGRSCTPLDRYGNRDVLAYRVSPYFVTGTNIALGWDTVSSDAFVRIIGAGFNFNFDGWEPMSRGEDLPPSSATDGLNRAFRNVRLFNDDSQPQGYHSPLGQTRDGQSAGSLPEGFPFRAKSVFLNQGEIIETKVRDASQEVDDGDISLTIDLFAAPSPSSHSIVYPITVRPGNTTVSEAQIMASVDLFLSTKLPYEVEVDYETRSGTAVAGADFESRTGTVVFTPNTDQISIRIPITEDGLKEQTETFSVRLTASRPALSLDPEEGIITIEDNDSEGVGSALYSQEAYLKASNAGSRDRFGDSVAISGNTIVVGAWREESVAMGVNGDQEDNSVSDSGAAYVLIRDGGGWRQQAYLKASNLGSNDQFGRSVAISGDTIVVGAPRDDGRAVAIGTERVSHPEWESGAAYVFVRDGGVWRQQAYLKASNLGSRDLFGSSVSISGDTIVVGADSEDSGATGVNGDQEDNSVSKSGAAYVFIRDGGGWRQQAYLKASNSERLDTFGSSVSISGDTIVVGADAEDSGARGIDGDQEDETASNSGAAYVFNRDGGVWRQEAYLKASNSESGDLFGSSLAISGDTIVVGTGYEDSGATGVDGDQEDNSASASGAAYVFVREGGLWRQQAYLKASNSESDDRFGTSVSISADTILVGAHWEKSGARGVNGDPNDNSAFGCGAAYVFLRDSGMWRQEAYLKASNSESNDRFGGSVSISGDTIVIGANGEASGASGVNGNQEDNSAFESGAAYIFRSSTNRAKPIVRISELAIVHSGDPLLTLFFSGEPGITNWRIVGSRDLEYFGDDLTPNSIFLETAPGRYEARVRLEQLHDRYFIRIER